MSWLLGRVVPGRSLLGEVAEVVNLEVVDLGVGLCQSAALLGALDGDVHDLHGPGVDAGGNPVPLDNRLYNTFITTAGVSIFVPRMKPRLFNF